MKAMILNRYGDDADFELGDIEKPTVSAGQVLVKVAASSVNTVDTMIRQMGQEQLPLSPDLPAVLGMDFSGTVESVGPGVTAFSPGDEVYGCAGGLIGLQGSLADFMLADARLIAHKPRSLSMREAAALPLVAITAYEGLQRAGIARDQKVLVHGGAGGVGHVATQLAVHYGAKVAATGRGTDQLEVIKRYGASPIDYTQEAVSDYVTRLTEGRGFDLIFDSVGAANMTRSFEAAALNGQIASTVALVDLDLSPAHFKGLSIHVVFMLIPMLHDHGRATHGKILEALATIVDAGGLQPLVDEHRFSLDDVGAAYDHLTSGQAMGKVVIEY
ncbi:MAG: zinc-dependent alcohol dehydrogenase family protein [Pseudomonadota bacterium]